MKRSLLLAAVFLLFFSLAGFSQSPSEKSNSAPQEKTLEEKMEGTYFLIQKNNKITELLTTETLKDIEAHRDATKEIFWDFSKNITIKILPKSVINAPGFDPKKSY